MKHLFNAMYVLIFIAFLRKVYDKMAVDVDITIPCYEGDGSDCWVIQAGDCYVAWSYDMEKARVLARAIKKEFPSLNVVMVEDEDIQVDDMLLADTGLDRDGCERLTDIVHRWHLDD